MNKVFIVVEPIYEGDTILRVTPSPLSPRFSKYEDALVYGEDLLFEGAVDDFDIYEREVY